jgi:PhnO protein
MNTKIRKAIEQDAEEIYELICALENTRFPKETVIELVKQNLIEENIGYFVAQIDKKIVGFGSIYINKLLHHCGKIAEIQELIVERECRNRSIGKMLIRKMNKWVQRQGVTQIEVTCNNLRVDAQRFYKVNGFVSTHQKLVYEYEKNC